MSEIKAAKFERMTADHGLYVVLSGWHAKHACVWRLLVATLTCLIDLFYLYAVGMVPCTNSSGHKREEIIATVWHWQSGSVMVAHSNMLLRPYVKEIESNQVRS